MRDSPISTRHDHNPIISTRHYRRGDHVVPPESAVSGGRAYNRPVTLPSLVIYEATVVLLARTLQVFMLLLPPHHLSPRPPTPPPPHTHPLSPPTPHPPSSPPAQHSPSPAKWYENINVTSDL
jgi:hypothetical protein